MNVHSLVAVFALGGLAAAPAQEPLTAQAPAIYVERLGPALRAALGRPVEVTPLDAWAAPGPTAVWLVDEWTLMRWSAAPEVRGGAGLFLPFAVDHVLVAPAALGTRRSWTWEEIALDPSFHDRLALVDPQADGGPWAAMLRSMSQRGRPRADTIALWRTFDARAGQLCADHAAAAASLLAGRSVGWIAPRGYVLRRSPPLRDFLFHEITDSRARLGVAVLPGADPAWSAALAGLGHEGLTGIATAVGVDLAEPGLTALPHDLADGLYEEFRAEVRGRGRAAEDLADWVDLTFVVASLGLLLLVWRRSRSGSLGISPDGR